jgi:ferrochelatase
MVLPTDLAVLLVAHGTVATREDMPAFLLAIRRGRPPSDALIAEMQHRYDSIGGSPLLATTREQAERLEVALGRPVYVGMRFAEPSIESAVAHAAKANVRKLVVVPMAPYSVPLYVREVRERSREQQERSPEPLELLPVPPWGSHPELLRAHRDNILAHAAHPLSRGAPLLLTAHSLPMRVIEAGDSYGEQVAAAARALGGLLGLDCSLGFQSEGADGGRWLGPSIQQQLEAFADAGVRQLVVAPIGFLCDHVETLYDLDREFAQQARARGIELVRVPALGTQPGLIRTLSFLVSASWSRRQNPSETCTEGTTQRD